MLKITWEEERDKFKHCFAICNVESAISLWWNLIKGGSKDGCKAINVKAFDLSGNEITELSKFVSSAEYTHS